MHHSIAILLFAQNAKKDALDKKKGWSSTLRQTTAVFELLTKRTLQTVRATHLPFFLSSDVGNDSESFGSQLASSVKEVFEKGFQSVICIGNDCPQLTLELLQKTSIHLQNGQSVVGPDNRGGAYLIGIQKEDFQAKIFENLSWQTAELRENLVQMLGRETQLLPIFSDINAEIDLHDWAKKAKSFGELLLSLLVQLSPAAVFQPIFTFAFSSTSYRLRPPPVLVS
ncbi:DUF2064 domain-containing protein [Runella sp.]|uniref:DUF2064 domain-containing protein n=1 Tax=Runella sp. TaxID=1960881 RepID=UPI00262EE0F0|nr:DUF2064 domain-containing protein [Runella sp.]